MSAPTAVRLDDQLCFALYAASNSLTRAYRPLLAGIGLTYPQFLVMMALWEQDDLPVQEIGRCADLPANSVTPMVRRLVEAGFVTRHGDPDDGRVVRVRLTAAGARLEESAARARTAVLERTGLSAAAYASLRTALQDLVATTAHPLAPAVDVTA